MSVHCPKHGACVQRLNIRPITNHEFLHILLSRYRAIENGANFLAEGFLFTVATALIIAETWRSARSSSKRRDDVDDKLDELQMKMKDVSQWMEGAEQRYMEVQQRYVSLRIGFSNFRSTSPSPNLPTLIGRTWMSTTY